MKLLSDIQVPFSTLYFLDCSVIQIIFWYPPRLKNLSMTVYSQGFIQIIFWYPQDWKICWLYTVRASYNRPGSHARVVYITRVPNIWATFPLRPSVTAVMPFFMITRCSNIWLRVQLFCCCFLFFARPYTPLPQSWQQCLASDVRTFKNKDK